MRRFHEKVNMWVLGTFGEEYLVNKVERNDRFIEEAVELVQSTGMSKERVLAMVDYVYSRPVGEVYQEVGGVAVTLAALCTAQTLSLSDCASIELSRIQKKSDVIREKQKTKPRESLPA